MRTKKILILAAAVCLGAYGAYMVSVKAEEYKTVRELPVWLGPTLPPPSTDA